MPLKIEASTPRFRAFYDAQIASWTPKNAERQALVGRRARKTVGVAVGILAALALVNRAAGWHLKDAARGLVIFFLIVYDVFLIVYDVSETLNLATRTNA